MTSLKLLRTIRFDDTDDRVYERAAAPDEWAVSGAFAFADLDPAAVTGKTRQAFANGFLGVASFGRSTFATVGEIEPAELEAIESALAAHFVAAYGAPGLDAARPAAAEELRFVAGLVAEAPVNTVFTVRRRFDEEGRIREEFRTIQAPRGQVPHARIWTVVEDDG